MRETPKVTSPIPREAVEYARGEVHHLLNPGIGWLRLCAAEGKPVTASMIESMIASMTKVTDLMDALLGEDPMRDQLAALQAQIVVREQLDWLQSRLHGDRDTPSTTD